MVVILWPFSMAGIVTAAIAAMLLMLLSRHFKALLTPKPVNPLEVDQPVILTQQNSDPAIAVSRMLDMHIKQFPDHRLIFIRQFRLIPLSASRLAQHLTGFALGDSQLTANMFNSLSSPSRD